MVDPYLLVRVDEARGQASRDLFINNAIERLCGDFEVFGDIMLRDA